MKLNYKKGIEIAIAKSGLTQKEFRERLGINNNMTFWNRKNSPNLTLTDAVKIAEVAGITIFELIEDMKEREPLANLATE